MGRESEHLPPSEALPGMGKHDLVFHNGKGFYYVCKEFSTCLYKRQFECVRAECGVVATMGPELGSPLLDHGRHSHPEDWSYRDKCLMLHTITQRFLEENSNPSLVLQDVLLDFPIGDYSQVYIEGDSITDYLTTETDDVIKEEEDISQYTMEEHANENQAENLEQCQEDEMPREKLQASQNQSNEQTKKSSTVLMPSEKKKPQQQRKKRTRVPSTYEVYHENDIPAEVFTEVNSSVRIEDTQDGDENEDLDAGMARMRMQQRRSVIRDSDDYMYNVNRTVNDTIYLRCSSKKKAGCRATAIMKKGGKVDASSSQYPHNHQANTRRIMIRKFVVAIYDEVEKEAKKPEYLIRPFKEIYNETLARYPKYAPYVNYKMIHRSVKRAKLLY